jgi:hypothetical protein
MLGHARAILSEQASLLDELGLTPELHQKPEPNHNNPTYSSELIIHFWESVALMEGRHDLIDVIEFHVVQNNEPAASTEELVSWLKAVVEDVCEKRRAKIREN